MKNKDKLNIGIFILLIVLILGVAIYNGVKNKRLENIDRKVEYIFDTMTYDMVFNKGTELFTQGIKLLISDNELVYEKNKANEVIFFSINNYHEYKKVENFSLIFDTFTKEEVTKYMELKKIIYHKNNYYIENYKNQNNTNYIGSIIDIDNYDDKYVYFKSANFYCDNYEYKGVLENIPNCNYTSNEKKFTLIHENNSLKLSNLEELINIIQ